MYLLLAPINMSSSSQSSFEVWNNFFLSAGIPVNVSRDYAVTFSQHRIRIDMLKEITKDILLDMGIKAMGDIIAILRYAKNICTQNELKSSGMVKSITPAQQLINPHITSADDSPTPQHISQRMAITTNKTLSKLAPPTSSLGNKIQSRLNLSSGAVIASSNNNGHNDIRHSDSALSSSLAKRLAPAPTERKLDLNLSEKTLTVHYPSRAAIARAAQRISGSSLPSDDISHNTSTQPVSIKSRLGSARTSSGNKTESNSGNTIKIRNDNGIGKHNNGRSNSRTTDRDFRSRSSRQSDDHESRGSTSKVQQNHNRPKSTVFSRLGHHTR